MGHMNNTEYPDMLCDFLPDPSQGLVTRISIDFRREAPLGAEMTILRAEEMAEAALRRFYFESRIGGECGVRAMIELSKENDE